MAESKTPSTNAELLITEHLDVWTTAIEQKSSAGRGTSNKFSLYGIKKLRELILELAVRGKLVPQDPNEEPASVLLERIAIERSLLIKEKKLTKPKKFPAINDVDKPFVLPAGWKFERFGNVYSLEYGNNLPKPKRSGTGEVDVYGSNGVVGTHNEKSVDVPCIIVGRKGSAGALNLCSSEGCWVTDVAYSTIPPADISLRFAFLQFHTLGLDTLGKGIKPGLNRNEAYMVVLALPPIEEQHRIVAKVDELMDLCDTLEAQTESSITAHQTLVEVLLEALLKAPEQTATPEQTTAQFQQNWQRLSEHFDTLFTTTASIDTLKQTILQLAVMGKLVPQNPSDEPAAKLLERIAAEKAQLIKDGKIKKQKPLPEITDEEKPFELPNGWEWCRVVDLLSIKNGYAFKSKYFNLESGSYILATPGNFYETGGFRHRGNKTKFYEGPVQDEFLFQPGDLIIPLTEQAPGLLGSAAFIPNDGNTYLHNQRLAKLTPFLDSISLEFVALFFNTPYLRSELASSCSGTTVRHSSPDKVLRTLMPVLPLAEQKKIVSKVDELMTLCDQLKARLTDAQTTKLHLTDAIVEQAL